MVIENALNLKVSSGKPRKESAKNMLESNQKSRLRRRFRAGSLVQFNWNVQRYPDGLATIFDRSKGKFEGGTQASELANS